VVEVVLVKLVVVVVVKEGVFVIGWVALMPGAVYAVVDVAVNGGGLTTEIMV